MASRDPAHRFLYGILEMTVAHLAYDLDVLKALAYSSWHITAFPHLRYTFFFKGSGITRDELKILSKLHERGLMPLVDIPGSCLEHSAVVPCATSPLSRTPRRRNFSTQKSTALYQALNAISYTFRKRYDPSRCETRVVFSYSHRVSSLFPNLGDIDVQMINTGVPTTIIPFTESVAVSTPKCVLRTP